MSKASIYEAKTESFIKPILDSMNFELVDVEYVKEGGMNYLRAYIDKEGGITVDDCEVVARQMNEILDREDYIPDSLRICALESFYLPLLLITTICRIICLIEI